MPYQGVEIGPVERNAQIPRPEYQSMWRTTKRVMRVTTPSSPGRPGEPLSQSLR
jgi:hypothetical protein